MKFIVNTSDLLSHLQSVSGVISSKPVIPILEYFLFDIKEGKLTITSTDLETTMSTELAVESKEDVTIAVPSRLTMDTLKALPNQPVTFTVDPDTQVVELQSSFGRYKLSGQAADDFPKKPEVNSDGSFDIPSMVLLNSIANTIFATGTDDLRLNLTGVFVEMEEDSITFVATDANRLVKCKRTDIKPGNQTNFILPKKALNLLKANLSQDNTPVKIEYNNAHAFFTFGDINLMCRLIDEKYPNYNAVIPEENPNRMGVNRDEFLSSVKRIAIFANKSTQQIRLKITGSEITISTEDVDLSNEASEKLPCEYEGEDIEIGFNARLLTDMLNNITTEVVNLEMSTPSRAGIMLPAENEENEELLMLLMPMMISGASA